MSETIIQERAIAKFAFEKINSVKSDIAKDYKSYIRSLPSMILNNGLGNALVFEFSKMKNSEGKLTAHGYLLKDINEFAQKFLNFSGDEIRFIEKIMELTNEEYQYWTSQILKFLKWGRKFAEGMLKE